jgi:hypothetical protein
MSTGGKAPSSPPPSAAADGAPAAGDATLFDQSWLVDSELVDAAYAETMADAGIQTSLPPPEPVAPPPEWLVAVLDALGRFFIWSGPFLKYLLIALAAALILFLAYRLFPGFAAWVDARRRPAAAEDAGIGLAEASAARARLADADALASEGRFAEAVHLLLTRSVDDIAARRPGLVQPALTARDLAGAHDLPGAARTAFARIARAVEITLFGGRSIDRRVWDECRAAYADLTVPANWAAA